ncbi:MAG TPA: MerR family transcriptional regulator [Thermoanaerobaculia bacterium]|nr:MerR family transcriptional regulator [Thermoanaerobaculia bacterium]
MSEAEAKRLYYKIGEACRLLDIQPYVLRYWETEFPVLAPSKSRSGQRVYSEAELAIIRRIKELLYQEGFTIAGAKKKLETEMAAGGPSLRPSAPRIETNAEPPPSERGELELDTQAAERIETIRQGVEEALTQAREILARLR